METRRLLPGLNFLSLPRPNPEQTIVSDILPKNLIWQVLREETPGEKAECLEFPESSKTEKADGCDGWKPKKRKKSEEAYRCEVTELSGDAGHAADGSRFLAHELCVLPLALVVFLLHYPSEMSQVLPRLDFAKVRKHQLVSK